MPYPATPPGPGFQETPHAFQETPHASHAEEDAANQGPADQGPSHSRKRARWPKAAHNTNDADREEEDGEHKAEDPRH
jgi:hypothetical protein